jgi:hypothetical protein
MFGVSNPNITKKQIRKVSLASKLHLNQKASIPETSIANEFTKAW